MQRVYALARIGVLLVVFLALRAPPATAQTVGITAGTPGIGAEVGFDFNAMFGARITGAYFSLSHSVTPEDVTYHGNARLLNFGLLGDIYLFNSGFRLSGGGYVDRNRITLTGTPSGSVKIGSTTYTAAQLGQINGFVNFRDVAPYAGLGVTTGRGHRGWAFTADAGVMFAGYPRVSLAATGPATTLPGFAADLATERADIASKLDWLRYYPVVRLGVLYRF